MEYYLQNVEQGYVGNSLLWWAKGGNGYTTDPDDAEVFTESHPRFNEVARLTEKYKLWEKPYIDSLASKHVDSQKLDYGHYIKLNLKV